MPRSRGKYGHYNFTKTKICRRCGKEYIITGGRSLYCLECKRKRDREQNINCAKEWHKIHKDEQRLKKKTRYKAMKIRIQQILGGKCDYCGMTDHRCLQIDHVNGGGRRDKRNFDSVEAYFREVQRSVSAKEGKYQLLCANCNCIKRYEKDETAKSRTPQY